MFSGFKNSSDTAFRLQWLVLVVIVSIFLSANTYVDRDKCRKHLPSRQRKIRRHWNALTLMLDHPARLPCKRS